MPLLRGTVHEYAGAEGGGVGLVIVTNDLWNSRMSQVGVALVRSDILPVEAPYAIRLSDGRLATAARVLSLRTPEAATAQMPCVIGPAQGALSADEVAQLEDALVRFLQLPLLLGPAPRPRRPVGDASAYPNWGDLYYARERIEGERKRFIVVSPNEWNSASGLVSAVRTTSQQKGDVPQFPKIQGGKIHACCGDVASFVSGELLLRRQERPTPSTCTLAEMVAIARGIVITHGLGGAVQRAGL